MKLDKIEVDNLYKQLHIREVNDEGRYHRKVLNPDMDVSGEDERIQEQAANLWTNEIKDKWAAFQVESDAKLKE